VSDLEELRDLAAQIAATWAEEPEGGGLTMAEWSEVSRADQIVRDATEAAATRRLRRGVPDAQKRVKRAQSGLDAAKGPARTVESTVTKTERDLAEARRQLDQTAVNDDDDLETRKRARVDIAALTEEVESLALKLERVRRVAAPFLDARGRAEGALSAARTALADLEKSISDPFSTETGRGTPEFRQFLKYSGNYEDFASDPATRSVLISTLKSCGLYNDLVQQVVELWLAGDQATRQASGILRDDDQLRVHRLPTGEIVAIDQRGSARARLSGDPARLDPAPDMSQVTQALYGSARTP
jgi:hypothetical protein